MTFTDADFWVALFRIIGVNIVMPGDNAVVVALAARQIFLSDMARLPAGAPGAAMADLCEPAHVPVILLC